MGLVAWYPLNGTLEDYSGNNRHLTAQNEVISSDGKIGKCYSFDGTMNRRLFYKDFPTLTKNFTWSCWVYQTDITGKQFIVSQGRDVSNYGINITTEGATIKLWIGTSLHSIAYDTLNKWTHIAITVDSEVIKLYINGEYKSQFALTPITFNYATNNALVIGKMGYLYTSDTSYFAFKGKINDVRIYDEALSLKEIKEIAKAKILHYNFNQFAESTENIVPNPHIFSSGWTSYSNGNSGTFITEFGTEGLNISNKRSWCGACRGITLPSPGTYTLSVWVKVISRTNTSINANLYTSGGGVSDTFVSASWDSGKIGQWQKVQMTRTYSTTSIMLYLICFGGSNAEGYEITAQYTMPQIELKSYGTEFTNGVRIDRVTDSSGFRNHSQLLGLTTTPQWTEDSILGSGCYKFNNKSSIIETSTNNFNGGAYSISLWFNKADNLYYQGVFQISNPRLMRLMGFEGNLMRFHPLGLNNGNKYLEFKYEINKWYHVVMTIDGTLSKLYVDGIKVGETTLETTLESFNGKDVLIGRDSTDNSRIFNGLIDDVRIYATALSDEDVKELYQSKGSVSKNGKLIINEIVETENLFNPNLILARQEELGVNKNSKIVEKDGTQCLALSASSFYKSTVYYSIFPSGYFKENTSYKFDLMVNGNLIHNGSEVPFGFVIYYTDGTSYNFSHKTSGTWKRVTYTTPSNKTIDKVGVYYYIAELFYCDINNCSITEVINSSVNKNGQLISKEIVENNYKPSLIDYSTWTLGDTVPSGWVNNGSVIENTRVIYPNPRGNMDLMWATLGNDTTSDGDGGFNSPMINIDKTKKHRFSIWIKRENMGDGRTYLGLNAYDSSNSENGLLRLDGTSVTNPYFVSFVQGDTFGSACNDDWVLIVGYVHPEGYSGSSDTTNGIYKKDGTRVWGITDFKWSSTASKAKIRSYLFYSTSVDERQYFYRPRIDVCDGSEPSIQELLTCNEHVPLVDMSGVYKPIDMFSISKKGSVFGKEFIEV